MWSGIWVQPYKISWRALFEPPPCGLSAAEPGIKGSRAAFVDLRLNGFMLSLYHLS